MLYLGIQHVQGWAGANQGMMLKHHAVLGVAAAAALTPVLGIQSLAFGAAAVLMDADHYLDYVYRNGFKDFSLRRAMRYNEILFPMVKEGPFLGLSVFHTVEALALAYLLGVATGLPTLMAAFWGMLFHIALDIFHGCLSGRLFKRAYSLVEYALRWNLMRRWGQSPEAPYHAALKALSATAVTQRERNK